MTNRIDAIDPAALRRGRFDHIIKVEMASEGEAASLLSYLLASVPHDSDIDVAALAHEFAGRPLSDISYLVREAARRSAKNRSTALTSQIVREVMDSIHRHEMEGKSSKRVGFLQL
jgi:ATP-dependent 26S proteasome regulatory subunit